GPADETVGIPVRRRHLSLRRSEYACQLLAGAQSPPSPSAGTTPSGRRPAPPCSSSLTPRRGSDCTAPPMRRVCPSSEIPADKGRTPKPGSVRVSFGAVQTDRAARIAKGESFPREVMESEYKGAPHPGARNTPRHPSCAKSIAGTPKPGGLPFALRKKSGTTSVAREETYGLPDGFCYTRTSGSSENSCERRCPLPSPRNVCQRRLASLATPRKITGFPQASLRTRMQLRHVERVAG